MRPALAELKAHSPNDILARNNFTAYFSMFVVAFVMAPAFVFIIFIEEAHAVAISSIATPTKE